MTNVADREQVERQQRRISFRRKEEIRHLRAVLSTKEGRAVLWRLLEHASIHKSIWEPSAKIHYNAGVQDFGHFIQAEIMEADQEAYLQMQREAVAASREENHGGTTD